MSLAATEAPTGQRRLPPLVGVAWGLLVVNTLGSQGAETLLPIPRQMLQLVTMGSVGVAFVIAFALNQRLQFRPNAYLFLLTLLVVVSIVASVRLESGVGALVRCARLTVFVATLWLLTPWWSDALAFVRFHVRALCIVLLSVLLGLLAAPGAAMPAANGGRLAGILWPVPPPQVGQFGAMVCGLTILLWLGRQTDGRTVALLAPPAVVLLVLSHTRTATLGLIVGLIVAMLSLAATNARARRVLGRGLLGAVLIGITAGSVIQAWALRGQTQEDLASLTGRQKVWDALLNRPRTLSELTIGVGLTDKSFGGLPIDSSWLSAYHEQGLIGVVIVAAFLATLIGVAVLCPPSLNRALALFLIAYCLTASYTEASLSDASPYLLYLTVAAALLTASRSPDTADGRSGPTRHPSEST